MVYSLSCMVQHCPESAFLVRVLGRWGTHWEKKGRGSVYLDELDISEGAANHEILIKGRNLHCNANRHYVRMYLPFPCVLQSDMSILFPILIS